MSAPIRARIIDIRHDLPQAEDHLLLDTNVCLWLAWARSSEGHGAAKPYQLQQYPQYIQRALRAKTTLYHSAISYAEIAHHIERSEYQLAAHRHRALTRKEFRQQKGREQVVRDIRTVWNLIRRISSIIPTPMDALATQHVQQLLQALPLGPFDLFLVYALREAGLTGIITDDSDFAYVEDLTVYTSNLAVIHGAKEIGRLYSRPAITADSAASSSLEMVEGMPR